MKFFCYLLIGMIVGHYALNLISPGIISLSPDLRLFALIVILARAGLALNIGDLKKIGYRALFISFIPPSLELMAVILIAPMIFSISHIEAAMLGAVLCAVSPAVVVPRMLRMLKNDIATKKGIPQLIMTGTSLNGVFAVCLFVLFMGIATDGNDSSIILRGGVFPLSTVVAGTLILRFVPNFADKLSKILTKLWIPTEFMLFVLVGAAMDLSNVIDIGFVSVLLIAVALLIRIITMIICLFDTPLNFKERLFCAVAYLPKATVQAAIGGTALAVGLESGRVILTVAVLAILITAPLGALAIDLMSRRMSFDE